MTRVASRNISARALVRRYRVRHQNGRWRVEGQPLDLMGLGPLPDEDDALWPTIMAGFHTEDRALAYVDDVQARQLALELDAMACSDA